MGRYVFKLEKDFSYPTEMTVDKDYDFKDWSGRLWFSIKKDGTITIKKGYAWDGCSIKINVFDLIWVGTPDGLIDWKTGKALTYYCSMVHDAFYQFLDNPEFPFNRKQADDLFLKMLTEVEFKPRNIYYAAVRSLGWIGFAIRRLRAKFKKD